MDDILIILPCGFTSIYKDIACNEKEFQCPFCKDHFITIEDCLDMPKNKISVNEIKFDLKRNDFSQLFDQVTEYDAHNYLNERFGNLKKQIDLHRDEIKSLFNQKIDCYYSNLIKKIESYKETKLKVHNNDIEKVALLKQEISQLEIRNDLSFGSKINLFNEYCQKIDNGIKSLNEIKDDLTVDNLTFNQSNKILNIREIFGELVFKKETEMVNTDKSKTKFKCVFKNISKFINGTVSKLKSNAFRVNDIDWTIEVLSKDKNLSFFLKSNSIITQDSIFVQMELRLINHIDNNNHTIKHFENYFKENEDGFGFENLISIGEIMDPKNGFYDHSNDGFSIQISLKVNAPLMSAKPLVKRKVNNDTNEKVSVHQSYILKENKNQIEKSLVKGEQVEFDLVQGKKGNEALNVTISSVQSSVKRRCIREYYTNSSVNFDNLTDDN